MAGIESKINLFYPTFDKNPSSVKFHSLRFHVLRISHSSSFHGVSVNVQGLHRTLSQGIPHASTVKMNLSISRSLKWWEKDLQSNMKQISSAQDLVDSMLNAGNRLVVIEFFSPGCGGCRVLHPKICQIAEQHPHVQFLQVNYEEHKSMCYTLNVHVLPFFRFYRGAHGRLCCFSCTNATIKKFRDALEKHTTDCCSLGPPKGLDESELLALSGNKDLSFDYVKKDPYLEERKGEIEPVPKKPQLPSPITKTLQESAGKSLTPTGR